MKLFQPEPMIIVENPKVVSTLLDKVMSRNQ